MNLAEQVKKERKKLGYKQEDFAMRVGVSLSFLRNLEQGKRNLMLDKVLEVLTFLGLTIDVVKVKGGS